MSTQLKLIITTPESNGRSRAEGNGRPVDSGPNKTEALTLCEGEKGQAAFMFTCSEPKADLQKESCTVVSMN